MLRVGRSKIRRDIGHINSKRKVGKDYQPINTAQIKQERERRRRTQKKTPQTGCCVVM